MNMLSGESKENAVIGFSQNSFELIETYNKMQNYIKRLNQQVLSSQNILDSIIFVHSTQNESIKNEREQLENSSLFGSEDMELSFREFLMQHVSMVKTNYKNTIIDV